MVKPRLGAILHDTSSMWLTYLFSSEECLWVELRVSFVDGQWNDPPLAHVVTPAVIVEKFQKSLSYLPCLPLHPYLLPSPGCFSLPVLLLPSCQYPSLTSSHCVPPHQCHPQYICGCGSCKKPPQPRSIVLLHLLYVLVLQPERMEGGLVKVRRKGGEGA